MGFCDMLFCGITIEYGSRSITSLLIDIHFVTNNVSLACSTLHACLHSVECFDIM